MSVGNAGQPNKMLPQGGRKREGASHENDPKAAGSFAALPTHCRCGPGPDKDLKQLLHQADDNMYQTKKEMKEQKNDLL